MVGYKVQNINLLNCYYVGSQSKFADSFAHLSYVPPIHIWSTVNPFDYVLLVLAANRGVVSYLTTTTERVERNVWITEVRRGLLF